MFHPFPFFNGNLMEKSFSTTYFYCIYVVFCQDSSISTSVPVLELIDAIQPDSVNFELVKDGETDEDKMDNAK